MLSFLKVFARGIICTILLPFILVAWVLYGVYCLVLFLVMFVKSVIMFFAGENPTGEMKEDIEAKKILLEKEQVEFEQAQVVNMMYQNLTAQQQLLNQQQMQQQTQQPQPEAQTQPQDDFDVFGSEDSFNNVESKEGDANDGQSY